MEAKITIYTSWFVFAIWVYIVLIYAISFLWFVRIKTKNTFYDWRALLVNLFLFTLNFIGQVFTVYLYLDLGKGLLTSSANTPTEYWILVSINLFLIVCYLIFFLVFSNNLAVKMTDEKLYLLGMSVLNSAFIRVNVSKNKNLILEYVYKHEAGKKWTERLKFYAWFKSTNFILKNYVHFFDPKKNLAFFNLYKVTKREDIKDEFMDKEDSNKHLVKKVSPNENLETDSVSNNISESNSVKPKNKDD